jgi:uncharacterized protein with NRDE domain
LNGISICYPKDTLAGGSWIAMNNKGRVVCLLNGAFQSHKEETHHTHSRGQVLLQLAATEKNEKDYFDEIDLKNTEPFTLITIDIQNKIIKNFSEFIWDGTEKHFKILEDDKPYIWASATLYNKEMREQRRSWFSSLLQQEKNEITPESVYNFHKGEHTSDKTKNVVVEREGGLKTVSITQITGKENQLNMQYSDLLSKTNFQNSL